MEKEKRKEKRPNSKVAKRYILLIKIYITGRVRRSWVKMKTNNY